MTVGLDQMPVPAPSALSAYPVGANQLINSQTGAHADIACTLTPTKTTRTAYLKRIRVTGLGITTAASIQITSTGLLGGQITETMPIAAGATAAVTALDLIFDPPLVASGPNVAIVVDVPSFGTGNTVQSATAYGFEL